MAGTYSLLLIKIVLLLCCFVPFAALAQMHRVHLIAACGFAGDARLDYDCLNNPPPDMETLVSKMIAFNGIKGVTVKIEDVPSITLPVIGLNRNRTLQIMVNATRLKGSSYWFLASMLAHELGHVYNGDLYSPKCVTRVHELNADYYAGFWARGANCPAVDSAVAPFAHVPTDEDHPPSAQRIDSVRAGWLAASQRQLYLTASTNQNAVSLNAFTYAYTQKLAPATNILPYVPRIKPGVPAKSSWWSSRLTAYYDRSLDLFATVTPNVSETDHRKSKDYKFKFHLTSDNIFLPVSWILPQIRKVTYTFDKKNLKKPEVDSYNTNRDNFGYTVAGVWDQVTVRCIVFFKDGSTMPIVKTFKSN
jgi:hypothetical protein